MFARALMVVALALPGACVACPDLLEADYRPLAGETSVNLCSEFGGKVLLIVNTASKCGFTPQYEGLEALQERFGQQGFSILGFPSNDFMGQEPGTEAEIKEFCTLTYGVKFPMFEKVRVTGEDATPLYAKLAAATGEEPGWNFHKYLVDRRGAVVASFGSRTRPDDAALVERIEQLLKESVPDAPSAP